MARSRASSPRRALLGAAVLAGGLLSAALTPHAAHAQLSVTADPVVTLSNGMVFDLSTILLDDAGLGDVQHISYTLHLPAGLSVTSVTYPDGTGPLSSFQADNTEPAGQYACDVAATTKTPGVAVLAFFGGLTLTPGHAAGHIKLAAGHAGDHLLARMTLS
jgi:hypothetical protein